MSAGESFLSVSWAGGERWKGSWSEMQPEHALGILVGDSLKNMLIPPVWLLPRSRKRAAEGGRQAGRQKSWVCEMGWHNLVCTVCHSERSRWRCVALLYPMVAGPADPGWPSWGVPCLLFCTCWGGRDCTLESSCLIFFFLISVYPGVTISQFSKAYT